MATYRIIAKRALKHALFLPRTLKRDRSLRDRPSLITDAVVADIPSVRYCFVDKGFDWCRTRRELRCLFCKTNFFRFCNEYELLEHLNTCHDLFSYEMRAEEGTIVIDVRVR